MCLLLIDLLICLVLAEASSPGVVVSPQNATVLMGENGTFSCNTVTHSAEWRVSTSSQQRDFITEFVVRDQQTLNDLAMEDQIFISGEWINSSLYHSTLVITGTTRNNMTRVQCGLAQGVETGDKDFTAGVFLQVLAPPTTISELQTSLQDDRLNISWSPSFSSFSIPVTYLIQVKDESNDRILLHRNTTITSLLYSTPRNFCSVLRIEVLGMNFAGKTAPSELIYTAYTVPSVNGVTSQHQIKLQDGKLHSDISFDAIEGCPTYPVTNYFLVLHAAESEHPSALIGPSSVPYFSITTPYIVENFEYTYKIKAVNSVNESSETEAMQFFTTDVQFPSAVVSSHSVLVECNFISGSQCRGCYVTLLLNTSTHYYFIERDPGSSSAEGEILILEDAVNLLNLVVFVFDWEEDGSVGNVSIDVEITRAAGQSDNYLVLVTVSVTAGVVATSLFFLAIVLSVGALYSKRKKMSLQENRSASSTTSRRVIVRSHVTSPLSYQENPTRQLQPAVRNDSFVTKGQHDTPEELLYSQLQYNGMSSNDMQSHSCLYSQLNLAQSSQPPASHGSQHSQFEEDRDYAVLDNWRSHPPTPCPLPQSNSPPDYSEVVSVHYVTNTLPHSSSSITTV